MIYGYPQPGKGKSRLLLEAFLKGAGGRIADPYGGLHPAAAAFYGTVGIERLFRQAQACGDWYYMDNAFFDCARGRYFRIGLNALQSACPIPDFNRLKELGIRALPWRSSGGHVLIVEQSEYFMREIACWANGRRGWRDHVVKTLGRHTDRELRVRAWLRDKGKASSSLAEDLVGAWALVTHSSAAANEALLAGVPVFVTGQCVASRLGNRDLAQIEAPIMPDDCRNEWAAQLAGAQWTDQEMRDGTAWRALQDQQEAIA